MEAWREAEGKQGTLWPVLPRGAQTRWHTQALSDSAGCCRNIRRTEHGAGLGSHASPTWHLPLPGTPLPGPVLSVYGPVVHK